MSAKCWVLEWRNDDLKAKLIWKILLLANMVKVSLVFIGPKAIAELVAVLQFALPAARAAFQTLSKFGYNAAV